MHAGSLIVYSEAILWCHSMAKRLIGQNAKKNEHTPNTFCSTARPLWITFFYTHCIVRLYEKYCSLW